MSSVGILALPFSYIKKKIKWNPLPLCFHSKFQLTTYFFKIKLLVISIIEDSPTAEYALSQLFIQNQLVNSLKQTCDPVTNNTLMKINTCTKLVGHPFIDNYSNLSCSSCCFTKF